MDTVSLRTKRPREGPADTGLSAAHGRSKAKSADAETRSDDEEYAKSESSEEPESSNDEEDEEPELSTGVGKNVREFQKIRPLDEP